MSLILLGAGALFALVFLLNNLIKAVTRAERVGFWDIALAFLAVLLPVAALTQDAGAEAQTPLLSPAALAYGGVLAAVSLLVVLIEAFRPQHLRGSRGLLGVFGGGLVALSALFVPFITVFIALQLETPASASPAVLTVNADVLNTSAESTADATERADAPADAASDSAAQLFTALRQVLKEEIAADEGEVFRQLDEGVPLSQIVEANGGDVERVVTRLSELMREGIRQSMARGDTNALQGAFILSQMETFVRLAVTSNLNELGGRFGGPTPTGTRRGLVSLLTETPSSRDTAAPGGSDQEATTTLTASGNAPLTPVPPTGTPRPSATLTAARTESATRTESRGRTPAATRTERATRTPADAAATPTPSRTRFQYQTATFTPTATDVTPCVASLSYNLRLRAEPDAAAETLATIPYTETLLLFARSPGTNADGAATTWYEAAFDGQRGWVDGAFLLVSAACDGLPIRDV